MNNILKVDFYDEFCCTADQCSFTCCEGWEIIMDIDTYDKWKSNIQQSVAIRDHIKTKKNNNGTKHYIKMDDNLCCPFLDKNGLCSIVIQYGEDYLSKTCKLFPRQENKFEHWNEYSLTCSCPTVVDIIHKKNDKITFLYEGNQNVWDTVPSEYKIRQAMITLMQNSTFSLNDRIFLLFHMLLLIKKEPKKTTEILLTYQNETNLLLLVGTWNKTPSDNMDSIEEINELFLDIVQNYKNENAFRFYLKDISDYSQDLETKNYLAQWNDFNILYDQYNQLTENCIISMIFSNCINDDIDEMILSFQMIVTEYVMVKHSIFLSWLITEKGNLEYDGIRDYIVIYSRIIGYNVDGMIEFWADTFDGAVWELGYLHLLLH